MVDVDRFGFWVIVFCGLRVLGFDCWLFVTFVGICYLLWVCFQVGVLAVGMNVKLFIYDCLHFVVTGFLLLADLFGFSVCVLCYCLWLWGLLNAFCFTFGF